MVHGATKDTFPDTSKVILEIDGPYLLEGSRRPGLPAGQGCLFFASRVLRLRQGIEEPVRAELEASSVAGNDRRQRCSELTFYSHEGLKDASQ
ncbi:uncharacterized protein LOC116424060 isoform X3 [Nomia melanderi]|uniref:uncharacterized protein LOC116424060 isoform X3 n=1 Tax=Nomia melanderi TaxID=2448451 RepID=UPI003FCEC5CA